MDIRGLCVFASAVIVVLVIRQKGPLCLCNSKDCNRRSQYMLQSSSASVLHCNDGLDTRAALCPLYEGKDQDGKCRFVRFFEPVAIASTQASSVGVTVHYRTSSSAIASNCIIALHKNNNIVTMPTRNVLLRHFCKMSLNGEYTQLHTLISYVLLVLCSLACQPLSSCC